MVMKKHFLMVAAVACLLTFPSQAFPESDDIAQIPSCPICGMDRHVFAHSRMLIHYADGSRFGACSLHCAALELVYRPDKIPVKIEVGDYASKQLVDAEQAVWVIGGSKMGVMTANAKWAFADSKGADQFISKNGGQKTDFESSLAAAFADMYKDMKMIREKRKRMKSMKKGDVSPGDQKRSQ